MELVLGVIAFILFFLYDFNQLDYFPTAVRPVIRLFFVAGFVLLIAATGMVVVPQFILAFHALAVQMLFLFIAGLFLLLLMYSLFFVFSFDAAYVAQLTGRSVYDRGVYALCRHPGVLWFAGFYFSLWLALGSARLFSMACVFTLLNICYIILQDCYTFPRVFSDYDAYKQRVPFLIPSVSSIRNCLSTVRKAGD